MHDHSVSIYDHTDHSMLWKKKLLWPNFHHTRKVCHCIDLHHMCGVVSLLFFFETQNISICRISLRVLQRKNSRCKGPKRDNDWSTWPSKRPRNSNTTSSASMWNLSLWMRNKHSSTMKIHPFVSTEWETLQICGILSICLHTYTYIFIHIIYTYIQMNV